MPWTVTSDPISVNPSPDPEPWISTTPPGCDSPSSMAGPVSSGSAVGTGIRGVVPPGMSNWILRSSPCWFASSMAARSVHSGTEDPSTITSEPVSHEPSPASSSPSFPVELTLSVSTMRTFAVSTLGSSTSPATFVAVTSASASSCPTSFAIAVTVTICPAWTDSCATTSSAATRTGSKVGDEVTIALAPMSASTMSASMLPIPSTADRSNSMSNSSPSSTKGVSDDSPSASSSDVVRSPLGSPPPESSVSIVISASSSDGSTSAVQLSVSSLPLIDAFVVLR